MNRTRRWRAAECQLPPSDSPRYRYDHGFSLVELSIVLIVLGLLTTTALEPLGLAIERSRERATQRSLDVAREALIGHVIATGVLPCPHSVQAVGGLPGTTGKVPSAFPDPLPAGPAGADGATCRVRSGHLPNQALGISTSVDSAGAPLDAWGNRLHYAVSLFSHAELGQVEAPDWTTPGELTRVGLSNMEADLSLCNALASGSCPRRALRASQIVAVIWSSGADSSATGVQAENLDGDTVFAVTGHSRIADSAYDDHMLWLSRSELSYWLLRAHWLD